MTSNSIVCSLLIWAPVLTKTNQSSLLQSTDQGDQPIAVDAADTLHHNQSGTEVDRLRYGTTASYGNNPSGPNQEQRDLENIDLDPSLERKKRRKITPCEESETTSNQIGTEGTPDKGRSWLAQLQAAATSGSAESQGQSDVGAGTIEIPRTPVSASPVKLVIRKSPIKTPGKPQYIPDAPAETPPNSLRTTTQSSSSGSKRAPSPGLGPMPIKKLIKLTAKGKLLSSPPPASPRSKRITRSKNTNVTGTNSPESRKPTRLGYGTDGQSKSRIGSQINSILSGGVDTARSTQTRSVQSQKSTHPFFLGKPARKSEVVTLDDDSTTIQDSDGDGKLESAGVIKPKHWEDLGFKKNKTSAVKAIDAIPTLWPPKDMQHLKDNTRPAIWHDHQMSSVRRKSSKSRIGLPGVSVDENVLQKFAQTLDYETLRLRDPYPLPQKIVFSRQTMMDTIKDRLSPGSGPSGSYALHHLYPQAFERMELKLLSNMSPTRDYTSATAQSWLSSSAPQRTSEVLQSQSSVLQKWLARLQVHNTATKLPTVQKARRPNKRRRKKKADGLEDFIDDTDEDESTTTTAKNAILITGPSGCGKTASVYAAAKELDFEVFEIHPGMRRSAKDIFDRVGDMTQNHLVHKAAELDRMRKSPSDEAAIETAADIANRRSNGVLKAFLGSKKSASKKGAGRQLSQSETPEEKIDIKPHNRKQSLILFEEVDILFEEDRGFWSGVIQLIEQSKRPAVLTCNDPASVPVENLPLHAILDYEQVPVDVAVDYVLMLAGTEGHLLQREAIHLLYLTLQRDLRATISELSFWCQIAVGSEKAGLDWSVEARPSDEALKPVGQRLKLFSKDTYLSGMGLVPRALISQDRSKLGALLQYLEDELGVPLQDWQDKNVERQHCDTTARRYPDGSTIQLLEQQLDLSEASSTLDLLNQPVDASGDVETIHQAAINAELAAATLNLFNPQAASLSVAEIIPAHLQVKAESSQPPSHALATPFEPLMVEKLQFPSSSGRLAPSLDTSSASLMTDIAPYVRSIVRYDQGLEVQRNVLAGGMQSTKTRRTRAARAALEGGSKASTREEKWFPKRTDYAAILGTGGSWPSWPGEAAEGSTDESFSATGSRTESTATSPAADVEMIHET